TRQIVGCAACDQKYDRNEKGETGAHHILFLLIIMIARGTWKFNYLQEWFYNADGGWKMMEERGAIERKRSLSIG
ncbi:MAG: hypothetical protein EDM79_17225, partial [Chloroflexi bacterium]